MKISKILFGLAALVVAFGLVFTVSAFKNKSTKKRANLTFYYNGPDYTTSNVTDHTNWVYDPDDNLCSGTNGQACTIQVDDSFVNSGSNTLKSNIALTASTSAPNIAYVTGSADSGMGIYNEARP